MSRARECDWVVTCSHGSGAECLRCHGTVTLPLPMALSVWLAAVKAFLKLHRGCKEQEKSASMPDICNLKPVRGVKP